MPGEQDDRQLWVKPSDFFQHLQAVHAGQVDVEIGQIVNRAGETFERLRAVGGGGDIAPRLLEDAGECLPQVGLVVDDQDVARKSHVSSLSISTGSQMLKVAPLPGSLSTSMRPLCR